VSDIKRAVELSGPPELQRLGKNRNGYLGETIDHEAVLTDCLAAARTHGWVVEEILPAPQRLVGLTRSASAQVQEPLRVYLSTGIHGDEPAGPLAVRRLLQENQWPPEMSFWLCPCLNPAGFLHNRRENAAGLDLNRQYLDTQAAEILAHKAWLLRQPRFDLSLCLHEDWESHGFYVYELNPAGQPSLAEAMIERVANVCPIDCSETIEGRPAHHGLIRPSVDPRSRPDWPEAFFLLTHKTQLSYTLEAPSDFPLAARVAALVAAVQAAVETLRATRPRPPAGPSTAGPTR
jgi:murein peptide amidase A